MKLSELILAVGDENVWVQNLLECATNVQTRKDRDTEISFLTKQHAKNGSLAGGGE